MTTPGSSAGATRQLLRTSRTTAVSGGQSGLISSVVGWPRSSASLPAEATITTPRCCAYRAASCEILEDRPLPGLVGAEVQVRIGEQAEVDDVEPLVAGVAQRGGDRVGEAEAGDRAGLEADDRGLGRHAGDADAVDPAGDGRGDVRAVALQVLDRGLVGAVAVGDLLRVGRRRRLKMNEHERATSMAPTRSGWVKSTPPSITPTFTPLRGSTARVAAFALIARMSHWRTVWADTTSNLPEDGSPPGGAPPKGPPGLSCRKGHAPSPERPRTRQQTAASGAPCHLVPNRDS